MKKDTFQIGRMLRPLKVTLLLVLLWVQTSAQAQERKDLRVAYFVERDNKADNKTVRSALESWITSVKPEPGRKVTTKIESNSDRFLDSINAGSHDLYGLHTHQYLALEDPSILRPCLSVSGGNGPTSTFLMITTQKGSIKELSQLRDKRIIVATGGHGKLPLIWLATKIGETVPVDEIRHFATITQVQQGHRAILPVYFGKADACIISREAFAEATRLNPDLAKNLVQIATSKPLLVSIFAFHRDFPLVPAEKFTGIALNSKDSRSSSKLFELVERTGVSAFNESAMQSVIALHHEFENLLASKNDDAGGSRE